MKFGFNFLQIITIIKKSPEKIILGFFLAAFVFLSAYLVISWPKESASFSSGERSAWGIVRPAARAAISVDFEGLLVKKPLSYYHDFIQRNPFSGLPGVVGPGVRNGADENGPQPPPPPPSPEVGLIYVGRVGTSQGQVAFIEGKDLYVVREGDEVEGWKLIKIEEEALELYNEKEAKEILLPLGGGPEEKERARAKAEERRKKMRERQIEREKSAAEE